MNTPRDAWHDPIVAEIHATRERLAHQFGNDMQAYSKAAEAHCRELGFTFSEDTQSQRTENEATARAG
jgi:hypothetical protein